MFDLLHTFYNEREMIIQMLEDLKKTLTELLNHEKEIRDSL